MEMGSASNSTRGIFAGGYNPSAYVNTIDFITIATTGNASDFGDITSTRADLDGSSSPVRAVFGGGSTPTKVNTIDYITIAATGNAVDFGDLTVVRHGDSSASNGHGGL